LEHSAVVFCVQSLLFDYVIGSVDWSTRKPG